MPPTNDDRPSQQAPPSSSTSWPPLARLIAAWTLVGAPVVALVALLCASVPAREAEPLVLAWLRTCSEHPLRTSAAVALLAWALFPGPRARRA